MNFNEKLISLRKSKGLSQEELGAELNVSRQTISKWESCQSSLSKKIISKACLEWRNKNEHSYNHH